MVIDQIKQLIIWSHRKYIQIVLQGVLTITLSGFILVFNLYTISNVYKYYTLSNVKASSNKESTLWTDTRAKS
jgi:hypothetical protein